MTGSREKFTKEFRREAVRLSRESGRTVRDTAEDLGVGMSTLSKWRSMDVEQDPAPPHDDPNKEGWLYLAVVMDLYSRRIVGWAAGPRMKTALPLEALNRAIALRRPQPGLMHHSDRGSQYCAYKYRDRLTQIGATVSMSGKGNCYDNAVVETFFKTLKSELVWRMTFHSRAQALSEVGQYIDGFYNPIRRHSACAYTSPIKYEMIKN